jgi:phosphatidate cytidylyltransferase
MLRQRLITAAIGLPVFLLITWFGNPWFAAMVAVIALLGSLEFFRIAISPKPEPLTYFIILTIVALSISPFYSSFVPKHVILTLSIIISLCWLVFLPKREGVFLKWAWLLAGTVYLGWMVGFWSELRNLSNGREWTYLTIFIIMASDTTAYFAGRAWGKHPMAPSISPKKTWEGAAGGFIASIIVALGLGIFFSISLNYWFLLIFGVCIGLLAQIGDLVESLLKRNNGVKDSGKLLPGHGGILDRIDSFILAGAAACFLLMLNMN